MSTVSASLMALSYGLMAQFAVPEQTVPRAFNDSHISLTLPAHCYVARKFDQYRNALTSVSKDHGYLNILFYWPSLYVRVYADHSFLIFWVPFPFNYPAVSVPSFIFQRLHDVPGTANKLKSDTQKSRFDSLPLNKFYSSIYYQFRVQIHQFFFFFIIQKHTRGILFIK